MGGEAKVRLEVGQTKREEKGMGFAINYENTFCRRTNPAERDLPSLTTAQYAQCARIALDQIVSGMGQLPFNYVYDTECSHIERPNVMTCFRAMWQGYPINYGHFYAFFSDAGLYSGTGLYIMQFESPPDRFIEQLKGKQLPKRKIIAADEAWDATKSHILDKRPNLKAKDLARNYVKGPSVFFEENGNVTLAFFVSVTARITPTNEKGYNATVDAYTGRIVRSLLY